MCRCSIGRVQAVPKGSRRAQRSPPELNPMQRQVISRPAARIEDRLASCEANPSFGKSQGPLYCEWSRDHWRTEIGLAVTNPHGVSASGHNRRTCCSDHAHVARAQFEVDLLRCASFEMDSLEAAQSTKRSASNVGKAQIQLHDLIARSATGVGHGHVGVEWLASLDRVLRHGEFAVRERGVAQAVAEGIEGFSRKVPVRTTLHCVILEGR